MKITVDYLTKAYRGFRALDAVCLEIEPGQVVAVLGANGAGKTTLLRCLATVAAPSSGRILFDGKLLERGRIDLRKRLFFLPDYPALHAWPSAVDHVAMVARLYDRDEAGAADRIYAILEDLDLLGCARAPIGSLSRGQAYKTALAALIAVEPELALFDEPFASGMDPHGTLVLKQWARAAAGRGATIVYSTQILEVAEAFSDRVIILDGGRLRSYDTLAGLHAEGGAREGGVLAAVMEQLREERR
jgi:ABC-type multidrug transport system ATPase subunit